MTTQEAQATYDAHGIDGAAALWGCSRSAAYTRLKSARVKMLRRGGWQAGHEARKRAKAAAGVVLALRPKHERRVICRHGLTLYGAPRLCAMADGAECDACRVRLMLSTGVRSASAYDCEMIGGAR